MNAERKLNRVLTKLIYEYFEDSYKEYFASEGYEGENEDHLLACISKAGRIAKKYHKDKQNEEIYDGDLNIAAYA